MYTLTPKKIAEITDGEYVGSISAQSNMVKGAVRDNREVKPGNMFVCICGERTDGHLYANKAFQAGASCCFAEQKIPNAQGPYIIVKSTLESIKTLAEYYRNQFETPIVGITGSVGKTTTKELVAAALSKGVVDLLKTEKNLNNELGVPLTLLSLESKHDVAVIEMGISGFGEMSRLAKMVRPNMMVITNIGYSHTNELVDLDGVLRAKTEVFNYMIKGTAILNGDDKMLKNFDPGMRKITFGREKDNDFRAENVKLNGISSVEMDITSNLGILPIKIPAYGTHLATLAPAAVVVAELFGLHDNDIRRGFMTYKHVEGRSNVSNQNGITIINDCYNANPSSVKAAIASMLQLHGRHIAVLGDMLNLGAASEELHYDVGYFAYISGVEIMYCCGSEATHILRGFKEAGGTEAKHYTNIDELKRELSTTIKTDDVVLIKASRAMQFERLLPITS